MTLSHLLRRSSFFRNVSIVLIGVVTSHGLTLAFTPIITRMYGPEAFGALGLFSALVATLAPLSTLCLQMAIVLPEKDNEARDIVGLCLLVALTFCVMLFCVIFGLSKFDSIQYALGIEWKYLYLVPIALFLLSLRQCLEQIFIRTRRFKTSSYVLVGHSLSTNISKVVLGFFYASATGLILIQALSNFFYIVFSFFGRNKTGISFDKMMSEAYQNKRCTIKKYSDFAKYRAPESAISTFSQNMPVILLSVYFGATAAGFFALARLVMSTPSALVGKAVGDVFYPKINKHYIDGENILKPLLKVTFTLAAIGFVPFSVVCLYGEEIFSLIFGHEWADAGLYASWLSLWLYFLFINSPSVKIIPVLGLQRQQLFFTVFGVALRALSILVGYYFFGSDFTAVALFSICGCLLNILLIAYIVTKSAKVNS